MLEDSSPAKADIFILMMVIDKFIISKTRNAKVGPVFAIRPYFWTGSNLYTALTMRELSKGDQ